MTKATYTWYKVLVMFLVGLAAVMGLAVMVVCVYDIVLTFQDAKLENKIEQEIYLIEKVDSEGYSINGHRYRLPDSDKYVVEGQHANQTDKSGPKEYQGAHTYRVILMLCLISGFILGFVQLVVSLSVVCSCSPDIPRKVMAWLVACIFIFLLGILCLAVPLSFNPSHGTHFNLSEFSDYVTKKFKKLIEIRKLEEFHEELFYYFLGTNEILLILSVVILGSLLRCGTQPYHSVYGSD